MLKSILVPIKDTMQVEGVIQQAAFIARAFSARIHLLGMIYSGDRDSVRHFEDPVSWNATKNQKQAVLTELATQLEIQGVPTERALLDMPIFETFIRYVQDHDFDLIIFAGDEQMTHMLIRDVLAHISVPVFVARSQPIERFRRILLPLDGSQRAECMMSLVTMLAQTMDTTLLLAHIIKEPEMPRRISLSAEDVQLSEQLIERNRQEGERYLTDLSARLPVATEIYVGVHNSVITALHELIKQQDVDLVGLCAHGFSGEPDWPFGGITNNLIHYCSTSLVVLQDLPSSLPAIGAEVSGRHSGGR